MIIISKAIVIPEPHISSTNIESRKDYIGEIKEYLWSIEKYVENNEDINNMIFVGDVFNRGFTDIDEYFYWLDWFMKMNSLLSDRDGSIYSAVGNHELSFSKSNPFWRFTSSNDSGYDTQCKWNSKSAFPIGMKSIIKVKDIVEFDDVSVFFCHYDKISECVDLLNKHIDEFGEDRHRVCISHNSIISNEIANVLIKNYGRDPLTHFIQHEQISSYDFYNRFDYVFNGHMHKAYSSFIINDELRNRTTKLFYLGSLGRTNSEEVNDYDLKRVCPVIDLNNFDVKLLTINLLSRQESLRENYEVEKNVEYENKHDYVEICSRLEDIEKPVKTIMDSLNDVEMIVALECAVSSNKPHKLEELMLKCWG